MQNLTKLEREVLEAVISSDFQDGDSKEAVVDYQVWYLEESDVKMERGQLAGAISSCVKKGFVIVEDDEEGKTIAITELGWDILNQ
jgi:hypothetical protein